MGRFYSQRPHSHHPLLFCHRTSLIFEKQFDTTCPQSRLLEDMKTHRREAPMQGSGNRLEDERSQETRIKPSQYQHRLKERNKPVTGGVDRRRTIQSHPSMVLPSANTSYVITVSGQWGSAALWGSGSG